MVVRNGSVVQTQTKSRDHEIVRAPKESVQGHPKTPPKSQSVVANPQM